MIKPITSQIHIQTNLEIEGKKTVFIIKKIFKIQITTLTLQLENNIAKEIFLLKKDLNYLQSRLLCIKRKVNWNILQWFTFSRNCVNCWIGHRCCTLQCKKGIDANYIQKSHKDCYYACMNKLIREKNCITAPRRSTKAL